MPVGDVTAEAHRHEKLIRERMLAGDSNDTIRAVLRAAGMEEEITDEELAAIRRGPGARRARVHRDKEIFRSRFCHPLLRAQALEQHAANLWRELYYTGTDTALPPHSPKDLLLLTSALCSVVAQLRQHLPITVSDAAVAEES